MAALYVWYGPPLQPWDDLKPEPIPSLVSGEFNGRDFLQKKWAGFRDNYYIDTLTDLKDSVIPWDNADSEMAAAAKRGENRLAELREALAMPGWRVADYERVSDQYSDWLNLKTATDELIPLIHQHIHARQMSEAAGIILLLEEAAAREIKAASLGDRLEQGLELQHGMVLAILPFLAAATQEDEALCIKLQEACRRELLTAGRLKSVIQRDVEFRCHDLLTLPRQDRIPEKDWPENRGYHVGKGSRKYFLNSRATVNLFHQVLRNALPRLLAPVPAEQDSLAGLVRANSVRGHWWLYSHPNGEGRYYVADELQNWQSLDEWCRRRLFQQRAVAVRIALRRWEWKHGSLPDQLEQLVPEFLETVPVDPFDGHPLRWIPTDGGVLYSVGTDWTDDATEALPLTGPYSGYFNRSFEAPALRFVLPSPVKPGP